VKPKFLADADFNQKIVAGFLRREPAAVFLNAPDGGTIGRLDPEVLQIAAQSGCILVSHDRRTMPGVFARFVQTRTSPGLIVIGQEVDAQSAIETLRLIWASSDSEEWQNRAVVVPL